MINNGDVDENHVLMGVFRTIRTMITENSTHKTQARAFSYFMFAGNVGIFIGPLIGMSSFGLFAFAGIYDKG